MQIQATCAHFKMVLYSCNMHSSQAPGSFSRLAQFLVVVVVVVVVIVVIVVIVIV